MRWVRVVVLSVCLCTAAYADSTFTLTWVVHPDVPASHTDSPPDYPRTPLELIAGSAHIALKSEFGALAAINQSVCDSATFSSQYPLEKNDVAKITFYEGGAGGYVVRRASPKSLVLYAWSQDDGACINAKHEPTSCPPKETKVETISVPTGAKIVQRLVLLDATGTQTPFVCDRT
jgi:hypothetical protein